MPINYELAAKFRPRQKAMLTRALNTKDPQQRRANVLQACRVAVAEWNEVGFWPDDWSRWERALNDSQAGNFPLLTLNDLE